MKASSIYHTDEPTNSRLAFGGMLSAHSGVFPEDQVTFYLQNENRCHLPEVLAAAVHLGRDQRIALMESAKTDASLIPVPSELAKEWEGIWKDEYGITADFAGLLIPREPLGYKARFMLMHEKASQSPEFLFQSDRKAYDDKVWKFTNKSLDDVEMTHQFTGTFGFWVADEQEAPDGCIGGINLNTVAIDELNRITPESWNTETLPMRQVHGRAYWREHKAHLDLSVFTNCPASRLPGGSVPRVYFLRGRGKVYVDVGTPRYADAFVRFRRAVVPSKLGPCSLALPQ